MRCRVLVLLLVCFCLLAMPASAQLYTSTSGLIHTPSADMEQEGDVRIGGYYLNKHFLPEHNGSTLFQYEGKMYNTADFYLSVTPFRWIEIGYTFTLLKTLAEGHEQPKFNQKDRFFSIKINPLREGRWWPALAVGGNDILTTPTQSYSASIPNAAYFRNYYIAATKHFKPSGHDIGFHLAYRYSPVEYFSEKWGGMTGGVTWRPRRVPSLRTIAEYTGNEINVGADCLLWKHLFLQAALQNGKYLSGGICFQMNLF